MFILIRNVCELRLSIALFYERNASRQSVFCSYKLIFYRRRHISSIFLWPHDQNSTSWGNYLGYYDSLLDRNIREWSIVRQYTKRNRHQVRPEGKLSRLEFGSFAGSHSYWLREEAVDFMSLTEKLGPAMSFMKPIIQWYGYYIEIQIIVHEVVSTLLSKNKQGSLTL